MAGIQRLHEQPPPPPGWHDLEANARSFSRAASPRAHMGPQAELYTGREQLFRDLGAVDRHWSQLPDSGCRFWSGVEGSCRHGNGCAQVHSHYKDQPTCKCEWRCLLCV
jgi:hypothetical protein